MSRDAVVVLALIVLSASWALSHLLLLARVLRADRLPAWARLLALIPVATPWLGLQVGLRTLPILWVLFGLSYVATRALH